MTVILNLTPDVERTLAEKAARAGQTLEVYLERLAEREARGNNGVEQPVSPQPSLSLEEFDRLLDELAEGPALPHLPADFSRADVYADHD
jgi:hypothetical protein